MAAARESAPRPEKFCPNLDCAAGRQTRHAQICRQVSKSVILKSGKKVERNPENLSKRYKICKRGIAQTVFP